MLTCPSTSDSDSDDNLTVSLKMLQLEKPTRPPGGGAGSPADRRGALVLRPPTLQPLHPLHILQPLSLQQQLLLLPRGARTVVLERCFETREDDWEESNPASSHTILGPRASPPSPCRTEEE